jgi:single stranded DNA-binding protein
MKTNEIRLVGNVTKDPNVLNSSSTEFAIVRLAVNTKYGEREETIYIDVKAFGNSFRDLSYFEVSKGDRIQVEGRLVMEDFTTKDGVEVRNHAAVVANSIFKIHRKEKVAAAVAGADSESF